MWGALWRLPIPNVEKTFLWRVCREILPTKVCLYKRKVVGESLCPICNLEEETCFHILWDCHLARDVWSGSLKKFQKSSSCGSTFRPMVIELFQTCDDAELSLFAGIARWVWFRRNKVIHGGLFTHPNVLVQKAREALEDFLQQIIIPWNPTSTLKNLMGRVVGVACKVALTTVYPKPLGRS